MDNEDQEASLDTDEIIIELYRISPDVKQTILEALEIYEQLPIQKNAIFIIRAKNDLKIPFEKSTLTLSESSNVQESKLEILENINVKNTVALIKKIINAELVNAKSIEIKEVLQRILQKIPNSL